MKHQILHSCNDIFYIIFIYNYILDIIQCKNRYLNPTNTFCLKSLQKNTSLLFVVENAGCFAAWRTKAFGKDTTKTLAKKAKSIADKAPLDPSVLPFGVHRLELEMGG